MSKQSLSIYLMTYCILIGLCLQSIAGKNLQPVIGIYAEPSLIDNYPDTQYSYIAASYVKYVQMAGARAVFIPYDASQQYLDELFNNINGILFPGGSVAIDKNNIFTQNAQYLINKAMKSNDLGEHFPIWATCLGFEMLNIIISGYQSDILSPIQHDNNITHTIQVVGGEIYQQMPQQLLKYAETQPALYYNHNWAVFNSTYQKYSQLSSFFEITAYSQNDLNVTFIASITGKKYPFFGSQFHPEKNSFEWKVNANHDIQAVEIAQYFADYFIEYCRQSTHQFTNQTLLQTNLFDNLNPIQPGSDSSFVQVYITPNYGPGPGISNIEDTQEVLENIKYI